jgi:hypothetical protein
MGQYIAPGVYIKETDLSQYAPALATAIFAIVGIAKKGPVGEPILITNELDLLQKFGNPDGTTYMIYASQQYLRNGRQLRVVRITDGTHQISKTDVSGNAQPAFLIGTKDLSAGINLSQRKFIRLTRDGVTQNINLTTGWAGSLTKVSIDHIVSQINASDPSFVGFATKDNLNSKVVLRSNTTGIAGELAIVPYTVDPTQDASRDIFGIAEIPYTVNGMDAVAISLSISAESPGEWANGLYIGIDQGTNTGSFRIRVHDAKSNLLESYDNLTKGIVENTINNASRYIRVDDHGNSIPPAPTTFSNPGTIPAALYFYLSGGEDGISAISDADYIGTVDPATSKKTGLKALEDVDKLDINLVAIPGVSSGPVVMEMLDLCRRRGDCFAIVDPPLGISVEKVIDWHNGNGVYDGLHSAFNSSYGATYWPWIEMYDPITEQKIFTPPSGWVAGQIAYTDYVSDPWFAPAGLVRGKLPTALRLEYNVDQGQQEAMYGNGNAVNPIVDFTRDGIVIWGQRTLQRMPSALDRVNVRRMLLVAEKLVATITKYLLFEPNDSTLWRRTEALINPILRRIKAGRGIESFSIVIDESTNPPDVRNRNEMHGKLFIVPTKAAEKIVLDFIILPSGAEFTEA